MFVFIETGPPQFLTGRVPPESRLLQTSGMSNPAQTQMTAEVQQKIPPVQEQPRPKPTEDSIKTPEERELSKVFNENDWLCCLK